MPAIMPRVVKASEGDADDGTGGLVTAGERTEKRGGHGEAGKYPMIEPSQVPSARNCTKRRKLVIC